MPDISKLTRAAVSGRKYPLGMESEMLDDYYKRQTYETMHCLRCPRYGNAVTYVR